MPKLHETVRRVLAGEKEQYAAIVAKYQDMLLAYAAFRVPDGDLASEVVQQSFIRAYEQLGSFDPAKDFGACLRTICAS